MLKRRINSATSSGLPQCSLYRVGSARSGEVNKKGTRCRPSSAPVSTFRHPQFGGTAHLVKGGKKKTLEDNSASHLKIEGKAIRSQNFNFTRKQAINKGTMKVYSNYRHPFYAPKRKGDHRYNYTKSKLDSTIKYGISKSSFDLRHEFPERCEYEHTNIDKPQSNSLSAYTQKLLLNNFFIEDKSDEKENELRIYKPSDSEYDSTTNVSDQSLQISHSYLTDDDELEIRPTIRLNSKSMLLKASSTKDTFKTEIIVHHSETDSVSNDEGSESTVVSLGQKIQNMAERNANAPASYFDISKKEENVELQDEWRQLLQYNHSLLLNECVNETGSDSKYSSQDNKENEDSNSPEDSDIEVISVKENDVKSSVDGSNQNKATINDQIFQKPYPLSLSTLHSKTSFPEKRFCAELPEICELDDISEEGSQKEETSENVITINITDKPDNDSFKCNKNENKNVWQLDEKNVSDNKNDCNSFKTETRLAAPCTLLNSHSSQSEIDEILTTENNRFEISGKVTKDNIISCKNNIYKNNTSEPSNFLERFSIPPKKCSKHQPRDILRALEMINMEQNKDIVQTNKQEQINGNENSINRDTGLCRSTDTLYEKAVNPENSFHLSVQHLIEKIFIFAQDLDAKMKNEIIPDENKDKIFPDLAKAENILDKICRKEKIKEDEKDLPEFHRECQEKLNKCQKELEERIHKNLELIRKLLDDKKLLTDKYEEISSIATRKERCHLEKLKLINDQHAIEMKALKEKMSASDQIRREKWAQQKTKLIKDSTYRGLETKIKDLTTVHREEISGIKENHWKELREMEQSWIQKAREQEAHIKSKFEKEKEEECKREREREEERFEHEIRQSELVWQSRLDALQRQFSLNKIEKEEDTQRQIHRLKLEHETEIRNFKNEIDTIRDEYENKIRNTSRLHENEITTLRQSNERAQAEWRDQIVKDYEETKLKFEKELRERLRRQRDKEIQKAITEIQQETTAQIQEKQHTYDQKIKNMRDRYERELQDLEECEKISRTRYLEMKGILTQREEEIVYLRARLRTQSMELNDYQQMFNNND